MIALFLLVDVIVLICWMVIDPQYQDKVTFPHEKPSDADSDTELQPQLEHCSCNHINIWLGEWSNPNTRHSANVSLMMGQRRKRCTNIESKLAECLGVFLLGPDCLNPLTPHDALKHNLTSLKTDFIYLQLGVLEWKFPRNWFTIHTGSNFL